MTSPCRAILLKSFSCLSGIVQALSVVVSSDTLKVCEVGRLFTGKMKTALLTFDQESSQHLFAYTRRLGNKRKNF